MNVFKNFRRPVGADVRASAIAEADAARDAGRWDDAARGYRLHLAEAPRDSAIWVQLGHVLKELGALEEARDAYERASQHAPDDPDPHRHRAHLLKRMDRPRQAELAFLELMRLCPTREAIDELTAMGLGARAHALADAVPVSATRAKFIEVGDLLSHVEHHATLTGIARVVLGLVHHVLDDMDDEVASGYRFVWQCDAGDRLHAVTQNQMRRVMHAALSHGQDRDAVAALVVEARRSAQPVTLGHGDVYLIPGAFWLACRNPALFPRLKRDGVLIGAYVYDLIPVTHARYCEASLTQTFGVALGETLPFLDFCLTISAFVAAEVTAFLAANGLSPIPTLPVPLAHAMRLGPEPRRAVPHHRVEELCRRPFVLCVCTIEARKNHAHLLAVWHRMIDEGLDAPDLVFVGRIGWRVADLLAQAEASNHLDGRLHILEGVSDADLALLYGHCMFTAFPSFVEGWGLPVGESLSHGKVCVASSTSSIPEVGGDLCVYIDPFSVESGYTAIRALVTDPDRLRDREEAVRAKFRPRTWADLGRDFFAKLDRLVGDADPGGRPAFSPRLKAGAVMSTQRLFDNAMARPDYVRNPLRLIFASGWREAEASGTWLHDPRARLRFRTDYAEGREVVITLHIGTSPWVTAGNSLQVWASEAGPCRHERDTDFHVQHRLQKNASSWLKVRSRVGAGGLATVQFMVEGPVKAEGGHMPVAVRLHAIGYAACDDIPARMELLENKGLCAA